MGLTQAEPLERPALLGKAPSARRHGLGNDQDWRLSVPRQSARQSASQSVTESALGQAYVRVIGTRLGRFVEFEFSLNDADLTVELVLPPAAFQEFCAAHNACILPPADAAAAELAGLRDGRPGLYRRPSGSSESEIRR